jgi:4-amino-4-deoxy-L-arabinose transferase-like glycosyltransferase
MGSSRSTALRGRWLAVLGVLLGAFVVALAADWSARLGYAPPVLPASVWALVKDVLALAIPTALIARGISQAPRPTTPRG